MENNVRRINYIIPDEFAGKYLKDFLVSLGYSSDLIKHLKNTVNLDAFHLLSRGERVTIDIIETENSDNIVPNQYLPLDILFEDEDILVVDKPANMPIHPSQGNYDNTLGNAVAYHFRDKPFVYRPITRLDKDTSGVCIIAKNRLAASVLSTMIQTNTLKRSYIGIVNGNIYDIVNITEGIKHINRLNDIMHLDFIIDIPIKREEDSTIKRVADPNGEKAVTKVIVMNYYDDKDITLCKFRLYTGRTHQIRVHMSHIGHPIIGDFLYNPDYRLIKRQALHSSELQVIHPTTHKLLRIVSKLPADMKELF